MLLRRLNVSICQSTLGAESSGDPNKLEPGQAGCLTVVDNKSGFQSPRRMSRSPTDGRVAPLASGTFLVSYEVRPGLAKPGIHYENINGGILRFAGTETEQQITIQLNDDDHQVQSITEPIDFHIILLGVPAPEMFMTGSDPVDSAKPNVALPGIPSVLRVQLLPRNGRDGTAKQNKDEKEPRDYKPVNTVLIFEPGETSKTVTVEIDPEKQVCWMLLARNRVRFEVYRKM
ncbi:hypothetical protein D915_003862 [Fasciola hepatica]|uniref:Calx-beta domain-containing protein n=1 Tax=Fasciola hepatica TaxID=6192 RepID=A0A4E0RFJ4_FASHE|nr:hypothetical protein D915_003862 [Fasciola hepatica]